MQWCNLICFLFFDLSVCLCDSSTSRLAWLSNWKWGNWIRPWTVIPECRSSWLKRQQPIILNRPSNPSNYRPWRRPFFRATVLATSNSKSSSISTTQSIIRNHWQYGIVVENYRWSSSVVTSCRRHRLAPVVILNWSQKWMEQDRSWPFWRRMNTRRWIHQESFRHVRKFRHSIRLNRFDINTKLIGRREC